MATVAELQIVLEAQDRASGQLRALGQDVARLDKQVERTGGGLSRLGQIGLAGAGIGLITQGITTAVGALGGLVDQASDLNEQVARTGVVFGDAAGAVTDFSRTTAQALGISATEALQAAGNFGTLFTASGLTQDAAGMSTELVRLAADLASFNNIQPTEALDKLRSGLVGEAEPLRSVGVLLNEGAVKARALELGLGGLGRELTEAEKVQARYALILDQTRTAQGDFARTSTGLANAQRIIRASFADLRTELGSAFLPVVARVASWLAQQLPRALQAVRAAVEQLAPILQAVLAGDLGGALEGVVALVGALAERLKPVLARWGAAFLEWVQAVTPPLLKQLAALAGDVWAWIAAQTPVFLERLAGEWGPAFVEWVAPKIPPLLLELGKLLAEVVTWVATTAAPAMFALGAEMGAALIRGMAQGLTRLGPALGQALDEAFASNPLVAAAVAAGLGGPAGTLLSPGARAGIAAAAPGAGAAAGPRAAAGARGGVVSVDVGGVTVSAAVDPQTAARQVGDAVYRRVLDALLGTAAATDPGAAPALQGAGR